PAIRDLLSAVLPLSLNGIEGVYGTVVLLWGGGSTRPRTAQGSREVFEVQSELPVGCFPPAAA
ncbi:MAG: hypothetical protein ABGX04_15100, partial [Myxococcales bacterium]